MARSIKPRRRVKFFSTDQEESTHSHSQATTLQGTQDDPAPDTVSSIRKVDVPKTPDDGIGLHPQTTVQEIRRVNVPKTPDDSLHPQTTLQQGIDSLSSESPNKQNSSCEKSAVLLKSYDDTISLESSQKNTIDEGSASEGENEIKTGLKRLGFKVDSQPTVVHHQVMKVLYMDGIQYSYIPSPNITILQSAVYQCTVDDVDPSDAVSIQWNVNGISSSSPSWPSFITNYSIVVDGVGTHSSTLTIPGDSTALNETTVKCVAAGLVNGEGYLKTSSGVLYIQGYPAGVLNLNCSHSVYIIQCTWTVPYILLGVNITGYNINISNETSNFIMTTVDKTEYTYNVSEFGNYTVSVAAVLEGNLKGEIVALQIELHQGTFDVQELLINYYSSTTGETCFNCVFLNGSNANGCLIVYKCDAISLADGDLTIYNQVIINTCINLLSCLYNISVYDIESDGTVNTTGPAAFSTSLYILPSISPSLTSSLIALHSPFPIFATTVYTTVFFTMETRTTKDIHSMPLYAMLIGIFAVTFFLLMFVLISLPALSLYYRKKCKPHSKEGTSSCLATVPMTGNPCYESVKKKDIQHLLNDATHFNINPSYESWCKDNCMI